MSGTQMRRYWDRRAKEDAFFFVDNRRRYGTREAENFWADGERVLDGLLELFDLSLEGTEDAVEIGCGVGRLTRPLASRTAHVSALDVSSEMLARAREHNADLTNVDWILGDGSSLRGVDDETADVCLSWVVFQHIPDPEITLGYIRDTGRVLRPGGWALLHVSNDPSVHRSRWWETLRGLLGRGPRGLSRPEWVGSAVDIDQVLEAASDGALELHGVWGEDTHYCILFLRKPLSGL